MTDTTIQAGGTATTPPDFMNYLHARKADLAEQIYQHLNAQIEHHRLQPAEQARNNITQSLQSYYSAFEAQNPEPLVSWIKGVISPTVMEQLSMDVLLLMTCIYRAAMLDVCLEGIAAGIPDAPNSTRQIMHYFDQATQTISSIYQAQLRLFQTLAEYAPDGIGVSALDGTITYANPALRALIGYGDEITGMSVAELIASEHSAALVDVATTLRSSGVWKGQLIYQRQDGTRFPGDVSSYVLRGADNNIQASVAIIRDVSDQLRREQELQSFKALVENASDGIALIDIDGITRYANPAFQKMLAAGETGETMVGQPISHFFAPGEEHIIDEIGRTVSADGSWQGRVRYRRDTQNTFTAQLAVSLMRDLRGRPSGTAGIARDITSQLQDEEERQQLQEQVIEAQKAALAELSTPLIPISDHVTVMPLIGSIDSARAGQIVERLLEGIVESHATTAIIDITGVPIVDTQVAQTLLRAAQAANLVGARVVLTGIRPEVAQTLVGLGVNMRELVTRSTLQSGIAYALRQK